MLKNAEMMLKTAESHHKPVVADGLYRGKATWHKPARLPQDCARSSRTLGAGTRGTPAHEAGEGERR